MSRRDLTVNILAPADKFEAGTKRMEASARALHASELRLIAAEERLEKLRATGKASAGQLASAQASLINAQDNVAKAHAKAGDSAVVSQRRSAKAMDSVKGAAAGMSAGVGLAAAAGGAAVLSMARDAVNAASELGEQMSATRTIFKDAADEVIAFGESADSIGISERAALQAANAFGDLFTKLGYTHDAAAVFSEDLVRISADFASFKDMSPDEVLEKLRSGLAGESEPLRALGVFLTEAKVKAEGMKLGLADAHGELDEGGKVAARYSLIMQGMGEAQGDVARTSDSHANSQRRLAAQSENLKAQLGEQLLPVMTDLTLVLSETAGLFDAVSDAGGGFLGTVATTSPVSLLADVIRKLKGDSEGAAESTDYLADSQEALADQQSRTRASFEQSTKAIEQQRDALDALLQATQAQFSSELAYQQAILGLAGDLEKYDAALAANRDGKTDNDVAARELTEQELALKDALLDAAQAAVKQAEDNAAAAGRTLSESEKYDLFRASLLELKEQFPALGKEIDGYVVRLKQVPSTVDTTVRVLGVGAAQEQMLRVEKAIRGVTNIGGVTVRIPPVNVKDPVGDGPGRGGPVLARVRGLLEPGTRVTSTYRTPAQNARVGGSPTSYHLDRANPAVDVGGSTAALDRLYAKARGIGGWRELLWRVPGHHDHVHFAATGGPIRGAGTGTSDSIPAMGPGGVRYQLSNGEHVWTAREVTAAGGHAAVERLRQLVRGYATGGPVARAAAAFSRLANPLPSGMNVATPATALTPAQALRHLLEQAA